jgi:hypothetical protein
MKRILYSDFGGLIYSGACLTGSQIIIDFPGKTWVTSSMTGADR